MTKINNFRTYILFSLCLFTFSCRPIQVDVNIIDSEATVQYMFSEAKTETAEFELAVSAELTKQAPTLTETIEPNLQGSNTSTLEPGEIQSLNEQIQQYPDDPFLRYTLGVAYLKVDRPQLARDAFQKAYQLAEDNPQIILELGDKLTKIDIWTYAAYSFLKVEQLGSPIPPEELDEKIGEALYHAAFEDYSLEVLSGNNQIVLEPAQLQLLEARRALLNGRVDVAERLVEQVLVDRPDLYEAVLLKSDILFAQERYEEARDLLLALERKENLPEWIREVLQF